MTIIVVGNNSYTTSLEPTHAAEDHGHDELPMEDSNLKDGQIILKANPPPDGKYIWIQKDNEDQFTVETDGVVRCKALVSSGGLETLDDGAFGHKYENSTAVDNNFIRVGRQENIQDQTVGLLDGIRHQRTIDGQVHDFLQQLHPSLPKIDISGTTDDNVDWIRIIDESTANTVFAVHSDGTIETKGWDSVDNNHSDAYHHGLALEGNSVYVGTSKLSIKNGKLQISQLKAPPYIPKMLTEFPWNLTPSNINANTVRSINDWMVLARTTYGDATAAKGLRLREVFPYDYRDDDFEPTEGFPNHLDDRTEIVADRILCDYIRSKTGSHIGKLRVKELITGASSVWMGERLHISTDTGRALMLYRKENIPAYLTALGVNEADVLALPSTLATLTLQQIEDLSVAASGSDELSVIFPFANVAQDFELNSQFNEVKISPIEDSASSGLEINMPSGGHPLINFKGDGGTGNGYGMLQFADQSAAKSLLYSSRADDSFHIDQLSGDVKVYADSLRVDCSSLDLASGCALTREGVSIEGGGTAPVTQVVYVDAGYSGGGGNGSVLKPYQTLTAALTAKLVDASTVNYIFKVGPGVYTAAISITHTTATQSFKIEGSGEQTIIQSGTTFAAGKDSNVLFFRRFKTVELSNVTIQNGLYGFYPRDCTKVVCSDVKFQYLGSDGTLNRHNLTGTKQNQIDFWASTSTSSGGACRIRDIGQLTMRDCEVEYCLRGLRLQDVGSAETSSLVSNCRVFRSLEASFYAASSSYDGANGCINLTFTGCYSYEAFNNAYLLIGGKGIVVQGCTAVRSASAGIQAWHSLDLQIIDNNLFDCNLLSFNGIGNDSDSFAAISIDGNTNIGSGTYMAVIEGNQMSKCNQGRAAAVHGISIQRTDASNGAYPTASNKVIVSGNKSDAAVRVFNENSIPVTAVEDVASSTDLVVAAVDANASVSIQTETTAAHSSSISMIVDSSNDLADRSYRFFADNSLQFQTYTGGAWMTGLRLFPGGQVNIGLPAPSGISLGSFRVASDFYFNSTGTFNSAVTMNSDLILEGTNVKDKLDTIAAPTKIFDDNSSTNKGSGGTPRVLPNDDEIIVVAGGDSGYGVLNEYSYRLPAHNEGRHVRFYNYADRINIRQADESANAGDVDFIFYWTGSAWGNSAQLAVYNKNSEHDTNIIDCYCRKHPTHATFHYWAISKGVTAYTA